MPKIMIIEDQPQLRMLYRIELEGMGYEVECAEDGRKALSELKEFRPNLIVLDINMPQGDGLEFLEWVISNHVGIPVIIYTAYSHYRDQLICMGAEAYLIKSSDMTELKVEIIRLLGTESVVA